MSSLQSMLAALAISASAAGIGAGCAAGNAGDEPATGADVGVVGETPVSVEEHATAGNEAQSLAGIGIGDEPIGESQSRQQRYGGGGGDYYNSCYGRQDGTYCGGNGISGDPSTLYQCAGGMKYFRQYCGPTYGPVYGGYGRRYGGGGGGGGGGGCVRMPPGYPDYCG